MIRKNNKRVLYESIMRDVAKTVKRNLNEGRETRLADDTINSGLEYIQNDPEMNKLYRKTMINQFIPSRKLVSIATDGENIYYNPEFISDKSDVEIAFMILHECVHLLMNHKATTLEDNIALDKKVNHYLEERWPEFEGIAMQLDATF